MGQVTFPALTVIIVVGLYITADRQTASACLPVGMEVLGRCPPLHSTSLTFANCAYAIRGQLVWRPNIGEQRSRTWCRGPILSCFARPQFRIELDVFQCSRRKFLKSRTALLKLRPQKSIAVRPQSELLY